MIKFSKESYEQLEAFVYEELKKEIIREIEREKKEPIKLDFDPIQASIDIYCRTPRLPYPKVR